jgi:hypothetical protein
MIDVPGFGFGSRLAKLNQLFRGSSQLIVTTVMQFSALLMFLASASAAGLQKAKIDTCRRLAGKTLHAG